MENWDRILKDIDAVVKETTLYDFGFLVSEEKKSEMIQEKKIHVEKKLREAVKELWPSDMELDQVWNEAIESTEKKFASLPSQIKINGFYLQELLHCYSEKIKKIILSRV